MQSPHHYHNNQNSNLNFSSLLNQNAENKFASHSAQSLLQPSTNSFIHNNNNNNGSNNQHVNSYPLSDLKSNTFINMDILLRNTSSNAPRSNLSQFESASNTSFTSVISNANASNFNCNALNYFNCLLKSFSNFI